MSTSNQRFRRVRKVIRGARRFPAYRAVRGKVLRRLRNSATTRELVDRAFGPRYPQDGEDGKANYPPVGRLVAGRDTDLLPVVVLSLIGVSQERTHDVVEEVARVQLLTAGFRPVFVLDGPQLSVVRRYGYAAELLIPAVEWGVEDELWEDYAASRVAAIHRTYGAVLAVGLSCEGLSPGDMVLLRSVSAV